MALIACPKCNKRVSEKAPWCPDCGNPIATTKAERTPHSKKSQKKKSWMTLICVLIVAPLFVTIVGGVVVEWMKPTENTSRTSSGNQTTSPPKPSIVGKWEIEWAAISMAVGSTWEFFPDGTARFYNGFRTFKSTYFLLQDNRIRIEEEGALWGTNLVVLIYAIDGDKMTFASGDDPETITMTLKRAK